VRWSYLCSRTLRTIDILDEFAQERKLMSNTYTQKSKEKSRREIWDSTIAKLTYNRSRSSIVTHDILYEFYSKAIEQANNYLTPDEKEATNHIFSDFMEFHNYTYGNKQPSDLKVAFFCGPEPINDISHLLSKGIRIENIWAIEKDKGAYNQAIEQLKEEFCLVNIFYGSIKDFVSTYPAKFDIIYLDFMNSLVSKDNNPLTGTIDVLIENDVLEPLGCLVINSCYPDKTDDAIDILTSFFEKQPFLHRSILGSKNGGKFHESFEANGHYEFDQCKAFINVNFEMAYSQFSSESLNLFSNLIHPLRRILRQPKIKQLIFNKEDCYTNAITRLFREDLENLGDKTGGFDFILCSDQFSDLHFAHNTIKKDLKPFRGYFQTDIKGTNEKILDTIKLYSLAANVEEGYYDAFACDVMNTVKDMQYNLIENTRSAVGLFCDVPMIHLWLSLIIGKYGHPYHINYREHKRHSYTAKQRKMCLDIFTLDQCRSLYDWLPTLELFAIKFSHPVHQILIRSYMDLIFKTQHYVNNSHFSCNILCYNDTPNAVLQEMEDRENIIDEDL